MIEISTTEAVNEFHRLLSRVERGETVRIFKHGRAKARLVPDCDFLPGQEFARIFKNYRADRLNIKVADAISRNIQQLDHEEMDALAH